MKKRYTKPENNSVKVIIEDLESHPVCPHGPTLLFSRKTGNGERNFYACSACRDRKLCNFFLWADEKNKFTKLKLEAWESERAKFMRGINHRKLFLLLNKIRSSPLDRRIFCNTCTTFVVENETGHTSHSLLRNLTDYQLDHPSELLTPLDNAKKEAQFLFSRDSVQFFVDTILNLGYKHVICIGTPRIHEYIQSNSLRLTSILLDIDVRFHCFFGPLEFCWFNSFNNHFFFREARDVFKDFLTATRGQDTVLITDPPFGGRIEPLTYTFSSISDQYRKLSGGKNDLPIFWIFPYFMEPQIQNSLPDFRMLDYKVQYDNHPLFTSGPKGRKQGSPVRVFTNISPSKIKLPENEYKLCQYCSKWVSRENRHCNVCRECTSKNGQTYVHCILCQRCVKPNWQHCVNCQRCVQVDHECGIVEFTGVCLHCKKPDHKRKECPKLQESKETQKSRKGHKYRKIKRLKS